MVVAVTYDDGKVGAHFGHAEAFKLFEVEDGKIIDSAVVKPYMQGHDAMVEYLLEYNTAVLICGGIGDGAIKGLDQNMIAVCAGVTGDVDEAFQRFLNGEFAISQVSNCNCHEDGHSCCGDGGSCGGGCCH